jgi:hypothetical protein
MLNEHFYDLAADLARMIDDLENDADGSERTVELLRRVDLVHREGLLRLTTGLRAAGAGEALDQLVQRDEIVRVVLGMYGLADLGLPEDEAESAEPAAPGVAFFPMERLTVRRRHGDSDVGEPATPGAS